MKTELAQSAGFCFGVNRAVEIVYKLVAENKKVCTLGPIIHNPDVVKDLEAKGVRTVNSPSEVEDGETLVIRSHGVPQSIIDELKKLKIDYVDATCPYVAKIHRYVSQAAEQNCRVIIIGDKDHPEVIGIYGHAGDDVTVVKNSEELEYIAKEHSDLAQKPTFFVVQTTFSLKEWKKCLNVIKKLYTNANVFDTICRATQKRQQEAEELSSRADVMIVVGGRESSNTAKLVETCLNNCKRTYHIERADELDGCDLNGAEFVGVTAGASTPAGIIKEVLDRMTELNTPAEGTKIDEVVDTETAENAKSASTAEENAEPAAEKSFDEMTFEEALEASLKNLNTDQQVKGTVLAIGPTEIQVDIGRKQAGFVPLSELTFDPNLKTTDIVKIGDVIDLIVMKTNDQEGTVLLSKRRFDARNNWNDIVKAEEEGTVLKGTVTDVVKGGVIVVTTNGARVFVPASLATLSRTDDLTPLLKTEVEFKVIEVNPRRRRAVGSIKAVLKEERDAKAAALWDTIEIGKTYTGTVKSLTSYGAFVDIGGVDGMIHISELSWTRIKHPSDVVKVGDVVEVYIKDIDNEKKKISLGYKKTEDNPWEIFKNKYSIGDVVTVKIASLKSFGAFAEIIPGVDGLIHISQIADKHIEKPADELSVGQTVDVKITDVDYDKKRINLSIRELLKKDDEETAETAEEATEE